MPARLRARLEQLSTFRPASRRLAFEAGVSRVAYSDADVAARAWLLEEIKTAGLVSRIDPAGNVFVRWSGDSAATFARAHPVRLAHRLGAERRQLRRRSRHAGRAWK